MADLTSRGKPVDDAALEIKRRRRALDLEVMKTQILREEIEILEHEDQVRRHHESIAATRLKIQTLTEELSNG